MDCVPFPAPLSCSQQQASASLRKPQPHTESLTKPNTSCTIEKPASLRSDHRSASSRNPVHLDPGIAFTFPGIRNSRVRSGHRQICRRCYGASAEDGNVTERRIRKTEPGGKRKPREIGACTTGSRRACLRKGKFCIIHGRPVNIGPGVLQMLAAKMKRKLASRSTVAAEGPIAKLCCRSSGCFQWPRDHEPFGG
jgi:hypothetical protein